jgi:hypothetical protein
MPPLLILFYKISLIFFSIKEFNEKWKKEIFEKISIIQVYSMSTGIHVHLEENSSKTFLGYKQYPAAYLLTY